MSIYKKLLAAQKAVGYVAKNGKNTFQNYEYATESDIIDAVKSAYLDAGLVVITSTDSEIGHFEASGARGERYTCRWAKVRLSYEVVDADTGDKITGAFDGYAEDKGDKAIYKATTGANKYFLMKCFGVATGDDPENEQTVPVKKSQQDAEKKPWPPKGHEQNRSGGQGAGKKSFTPGVANPMSIAGKPSGIIPENDLQRAAAAVKKLTELRGRYNFSNTDVQTIGQIDSIKKMANEGNHTALWRAVALLENAGIRKAV